MELWERCVVFKSTSLFVKIEIEVMFMMVFVSESNP